LGQCRQKIASSYADKHRQVAAGSAASKQPFKNPSSNGIKALPPTTAWGLNQDWDSAEEFPFASTVKGGQGYVQLRSTTFDLARLANVMDHYSALLFPANKKSQDEQKISLSAFYSSNKIKGYDPAKKGQAGAEDGTWFTIKKFTGPVG